MIVPLATDIVAGGADVAARIVGAVAGNVDDVAGSAQRRVLELGLRELDAAADRGAVGEGARRFDDLIAEAARAAGAVDDRPVDHLLLRPEARPFHEVERDLLIAGRT